MRKNIVILSKALALVGGVIATIAVIAKRRKKYIQKVKLPLLEKT